MEVRASANNVRLSPQKARLMVAQIKKMPPQKAVDILNFMPQASAPILKKVILSAIANAKNNFALEESSLTFKEIQVGKGPVLKRFRPVSRGRAHHILKRTSHIQIVLQGQTKQEAQTKVKGAQKSSEKEQATKAEK